MDHEEGTELKPRFGEDGLIPAIAQDSESGKILMQAYMNEEALDKTLETGQAHYWSRSKQSLWHKGATSGQTQDIVAIHIDCDQDSILLIVKQTAGIACHTGRPSCFYRKIIHKDGRFCLEHAEQ